MDPVTATGSVLPVSTPGISEYGLVTGLILLGGFEFLLNFNVLLFVVLYVALLLGVIQLRKREPETPRPYRAWGHPYSSWFCMTGWFLMTVFMAVSAPESALGAVVMISISIPVYWVMVWYRTSLKSQPH